MASRLYCRWAKPSVSVGCIRPDSVEGDSVPVDPEASGPLPSNLRGPGRWLNLDRLPHGDFEFFDEAGDAQRPRRSVKYRLDRDKFCPVLVIISNAEFSLPFLQPTIVKSVEL